MTRASDLVVKKCLRMKCLPLLGMNASLILLSQEMNKAENPSSDTKDAIGTLADV